MASKANKSKFDIEPRFNSMSFKLRSDLDLPSEWHSITGTEDALEKIMHALWESNDYVFTFSGIVPFVNVSPFEEECSVYCS